MSKQSRQVVQPAISLPFDVDLSSLSARWRRMGIMHRVVEEAGRQVVYAAASDHELINNEVKAFLSGSLDPVTDTVSSSHQDGLGLAELLRMIMSLPVTSSMIVLSVLGFLAVQFGLSSVIDLLVIQSVDNSAIARELNLPRQISVNEFLAHGHYWRLVTPIFLHFSWLHIVFNMLWMWELGRRIERIMGSIHLLMIVMFIGIASNLYQTFATPLATFGGMSGVIYGLLGYCAVFTLLAPHRDLRMPRAIYILMLGWLLIGYSGVFSFLAQMANTAHLTGLIFGVLIAIPTALIYRSG